MEFQNGHYLVWAAASLLTGTLWYFIFSRRIAGRQRQFVPLRERIIPRGRGRGLMAILPVPVLLFSLAGPSWGETSEVTYTSGRDLYFVIDCSYSMTAPDVEPSREQAASFLALSILKELPGARVGLITFAGGSFPACPLTGDYRLMGTLLSKLNPDMINHQGTSFEAPLTTLARITGQHQQDRQLTVVFISDGESFAPPDPATLDRLKATGMQFITVGIGTDHGSFIRDPRSRSGGYIRNKNGEMVTTRLEEDNLSALSEALSGAYLRFKTVGITSQQILDNYLKTSSTGVFSTVHHPRNRSALFIWVAFGILAGFLFSGRRSPSHIPIIGKKLMAILPLLVLVGCSSGPAAHLRDGDQAFTRGDYVSALDEYREVLALNRVETREYRLAALNASAALAMRGDTAALTTMVRKTITRKTEPLFRSSLNYNLGCGLIQGRDFPAAIQAFRTSLELNPQDIDAAWNLEWLLRQNSPPPTENQTPPPPDSAERFLDSLRDQEKTMPPRTTPAPLKTGGPYW